MSVAAAVVVKISDTEFTSINLMPNSMSIVVEGAGNKSGTYFNSNRDVVLSDDGTTAVVRSAGDQANVYCYTWAPGPTGSLHPGASAVVTLRKDMASYTIKDAQGVVLADSGGFKSIGAGAVSL